MNYYVAQLFESAAEVLSPVYTRPLIRVESGLTVIRVRVNTPHPGSNPD